MPKKQFIDAIDNAVANVRNASVALDIAADLSAEDHRLVAEKWTGSVIDLAMLALSPVAGSMLVAGGEDLLDSFVESVTKALRATARHEASRLAKELGDDGLEQVLNEARQSARRR